MITRVPLAGLAIAATVVAGASPALATAAQPPLPGYRCHMLQHHGDGAWTGHGGCLSFHGAPSRGPIFGAFTITGHHEGGEKTVTCRAHERQHSGFAEVPIWVRGFHCD